MKTYERCEVACDGTYETFYAENTRKVSEGWTPCGGGHGPGLNRVQYFVREVDRPFRLNMKTTTSDAVCDVRDRVVALEGGLADVTNRVVVTRGRLDLVEKACDAFALDGPRSAVAIEGLAAAVRHLGRQVAVLEVEASRHGRRIAACEDSAGVAAGKPSEAPEVHEVADGLGGVAASGLTPSGARFVADAICEMANHRLREWSPVPKSPRIGAWNLVMPSGFKLMPTFNSSIQVVVAEVGKPR